MQPGKHPALHLAVASRLFPHGQTTKLWLATKPCFLWGQRRGRWEEEPGAKKGLCRRGEWWGPEEVDVMRSPKVQLHPAVTPASSLLVDNSHFALYMPLHRIFLSHKKLLPPQFHITKFNFPPHLRSSWPISGTTSSSIKLSLIPSA